jgi:molybdenum cofactor biosynthesis enzyme
LLLSESGDVLTVAEVAGVMAAKRSADLLPHRLTPPITKVCCRQYCIYFHPVELRL